MQAGRGRLACSLMLGQGDSRHMEAEKPRVGSWPGVLSLVALFPCAKLRLTWPPVREATKMVHYTVLGDGPFSDEERVKRFSSCVRETHIVLGQDPSISVRGLI